MRLERLIVRNVTSLRAVDLDLRDLPPGLLAITGENGSGKTTLLEAPMAALYRQLPSRGGELKDYATDRDSRVEVQFAMEGVGVFVARVNVDGIRGTSDALLTHQEAVVNDGKVTTFDAAIHDRFPSLAVMLASAVAVQNHRGNFITTKPNQRKELFSELLALQDYEAMSQTAKMLVGFIDASKERLVATLDVLTEATGADVVAALANTAENLHVEKTEAKQEQKRLKPRVAALEKQLDALQATITAHATATDRVKTLTQHIDAWKQEEHALGVEQNGADLQSALDRERLARKIQTAKDQARERGAASLADYDTRIANNQQLLTQASAIRAAVATLADLTTRETALTASINACNTDIANAVDQRAGRQQQLAGLDRVEQTLARARSNAELVTKVPFGTECATAKCQFLTDAIAAEQAIPMLEADLEPKARLLTQIDRLSDVMTKHREHLVALTTEREAVVKAKAQTEKLAASAEKLGVAEARLSELQASRGSIQKQTADRLAELDVEHDLSLREMDEKHAALLAALEARATALTETLTGLQQDLAAAQASMRETAHGQAEAQDVRNQLTSSRFALEECVATLATIAAEEQAAAKAKREYDAAVQRRDRVTKHLAHLDDERIEWAQLQRALGRDGLPVLEMDAAGPRISQLTNELLAVCFGPRFSVELVTQLARASGKGMKESFELLVTDNERGAAPREVGDLSGGEQVIVSEALMNAISLYCNGRSPMPIRTGWRDETTGALDPENATRYFDMLRKVHDLGGYHHILFITHNPAIAALADAQIHVANGTARILTPPYGEEIAA